MCEYVYLRMCVCIIPNLVSETMKAHIFTFFKELQSVITAYGRLLVFAYSSSLFPSYGNHTSCLLQRATALLSLWTKYTIRSPRYLSKGNLIEDDLTGISLPRI